MINQINQNPTKVKTMNKLDKECKPILKVSIRENLLKRIPFRKLQARGVVATVLGFLGDSDEVFKLLQKTSHSTRAYLFHAI